MNFSRASAPGRTAIRLLELGLLLATPLVIYRGFSEQFTAIKLVATEGIATAAAAILAVCLIWGIARWPKSLRLGAPLGLLALSVLISCLASPLPTFSFVEVQYFLCGPMWLVFLVAGGGGECRARWLAAMVTLAGAAMAAIALLQWAGHDPLLFGGYHVDWGRMRNAMRLYSTLGNPNFVAGYLIGAIFPALALAAASRTLAGKIACAASAVIIFAAIIGTRSRGAWLALAAGLVVARFVGRKKAQPPSMSELRPASANLAPGLSPTVFLALVAVVTSQAQAVFAHFEGRAFLWRAGWPMFAEHPLVGGGWAMFQLRFPELQARYLAEHPELIRFWTHTSQLHNDPLQILYEAGALGLVALGWLLWRYARGVREGASAGNLLSRLWLGASAGGVTAILVDSLFNFQLAIPPTLILFFTLLALPSLLIPPPADADSRVVVENPSIRYFFVKTPATLVVILSAMLLARGIWRRAASDHALALGMEQERQGDFLRAERHFRSGLARSTEDGGLHYGLARVLFFQERHAEALAEVLRAERSVADAHLEVLRARILDRMGLPSPALAAYRHALWLNPRLKSVPADIQRLTEGAPEVVQ